MQGLVRDYHRAEPSWRVLRAERALRWITAFLVAISVLVAIAAPNAASGASYRDVVLADEPVAFWRFNETAGSSATDLIGTVDAEYRGSPQLGASGLVAGENLAVRLTGDDFIAVPDSDLINRRRVVRRTIELWFRADEVTSQQVLVEEGGVNRGLSIYIQGGQVRFGGWNLTDDGADAPWGPVFLGAAVQAGTTYHAVLVFDDPANSFAAFVDGVEIGSSSTAGLLSAHGSNTGIGAMHDATRFHDGADTGTGARFGGVIDDVAFYNKALSTSAIANHHSAGTTGGGSGGGSEVYHDALMGQDPTLYWRLGDSGGLVAADETGSLNGSYRGNPVLGVGALVDGGDEAVRFDGTGDYVALPDSSLLNLGSRTRRSVSVWVKPDDVSSRQVIYEEGGGSRGLSIYIHGGRLYVGGWNTSNNGSDSPWGPVFLSTSIQQGNVYNAVLALDQPGGKLRGYVNGTSIGSGDAGTLAAHGSDAAIGGMRDASRFHSGSAGGNGSYFDGVIDEVAVFNSVLSTAAVSDLYEAGGGTASSGGGRAMIIAAGDISSCSNNNDTKTADLIDDIIAGTSLPVTVVPVGDLVYPDGTAGQFANCYDPTWGRHKSLTKPVVGNHEYNTSGASGYYNYFGGAAAGPDGYYRYTAAGWEVYALNSACGSIGSCGPATDQVLWLRQQLAASSNQCTLAFMHHPRFTTTTPFSNIKEFWKALYEDDADLVVSAHAHYFAESYEQNWQGDRDANGIRQLIAGTGGKSLSARPSNPHPNQRVINDSSFGVVVLELYDGGYDWEFRRVGDGQVLNSGSDTCN